MSKLRPFFNRIFSSSSGTLSFQTRSGTDCSPRLERLSWPLCRAAFSIGAGRSSLPHWAAAAAAALAPDLAANLCCTKALAPPLGRAEPTEETPDSLAGLAVVKADLF